MKLFALLANRLETVYAHCDIPCGVYSSEPSKIAATAAFKMVEKIKALPTKGSGEELLEADNNFMRMVSVKDSEAQKCKQELLILWTDYFKPEHLKTYPDLHEIFWQAAKQCSKVKQTVSTEEAQKLVDAVAKIGDMFAKTEASKKV